MVARFSSTKKNLIGLTKQEIENEFSELGIKEKFRASVVFSWIYSKGARSFDQMTNLNKQTRELLSQHFEIEWGSVGSEQLSSDGTKKWLMDFGGQQCETVFIPETDRGTLCISSQIGCSTSCKFCHTGTQKLVRNLTASELVSQILTCKSAQGDFPRNPKANKREQLTNVVLMGQGEPLFNFKNVCKAMKVAMDQDGIGLSKRRITLSTSGVAPLIPKVATELDCNLAISLHAPTDDLRSEIVPMNKTYSLSVLLDACREYQKHASPTGGFQTRRITWEYVMLKGVNDSLADAKRLVALVKGMPSKVNLIPFNAWPDAPFECSSKNSITAFSDFLLKEGLNCTVRWSRGDDIFAACGQLKTATLKQKAVVSDDASETIS